MMRRVRHVWLALTLMPGLLISSQRRQRLSEMRAFCRALPQKLSGNLTAALQQLTPPQQPEAHEGLNTLRKLADFAALLERNSPLGLCLRRSLTRYYFLRRAGLPVAVQFGAKFSSGQPDRNVNGHAWLTLNGQPYFEETEDWRGFTVMFGFPTVERRSGASLRTH